MARGKNAQRSTNRRKLQHQARVAALQAEISAERESIREVAAEVEATAVLHERLHASTAALMRQTEPEVAALQAEADLLTRLLREQRAAKSAVDHHWNRIAGLAVDANGGGREGIEWFMRATGGSGFLIDQSANTLSSSRAIRLQKIRGERQKLPSEGFVDRARHNEAAAYLSLLRPHYQRAWDAAELSDDADLDLDSADLTPEQRTVYEDTTRAAQALTNSQPTTLDVDCVRSWHPLPWLVTPTAAVHAAAPKSESRGTDRGEHAERVAHDSRDEPTDVVVARDLGAIWLLPAASSVPPTVAPLTPGTALADPPRTAASWPVATPALSAVARRRVSAGTPEQLGHEWRPTLAAGEALVQILGPTHGPLRAGPLHPRPGRAASLRHLYIKAALGNWVRDRDARAHAQSIKGSASPGTDTDSAGHDRWGEICVAMTVAAPFWIPRGQTFTFADSEPLALDDVSELRLPFPQVFLAFAEPILIDPPRKPTPREATTLADLDQAAALLRQKSPTFKDLLGSVRDLDHFGELTLDTALDIRGAHIEGVLVTADSLGRLENTFAWCVTIPSGADGTLGRHIIPAHLDATIHRSLVENLIAVAAWADWHAPDADTEIPISRSADALIELMNSPQFKRDADRSGGGGVRVLNVRATHHGGSNGTDLPTREISPHVRRGHWRRQRFGLGSKLIKRIRIAPVIVNAHRGTPDIRVYTLPAAATVESSQH